jgi:7-cyano-7-deazaguanine synthase
MAKNAVLLSGGIDSIALTYYLNPDYAITIDYGQIPADAEIQASKKISKSLNIDHVIRDFSCEKIGRGLMYDGNKKVDFKAPSKEWWPFRNQLIISIGATFAVNNGIRELFIGAVEEDSTHKDGEKQFFDLMSNLLTFQEGNIQLKYPYVSTSSIDLLKETEPPLEMLMWAHSCHKSTDACGKCRGCSKYQKVLEKYRKYLGKTKIEK